MITMALAQKLVDQLTVADFRDEPVWEFVHDPNLSDTLVQPYARRPVQDFDEKVVGTRVMLACGKMVWAKIGGLNSASPRATEQLISLTIEKDGAWFPLARYFDDWFSSNGPEQLSEFLGLPIDQVFPIEYDLTDLATGNIRSIQSRILKEPTERLTFEERLALVL